jgi:hypothetical protein
MKFDRFDASCKRYAMEEAIVPFLSQDWDLKKDSHKELTDLRIKCDELMKSIA